MLDVTGPVDVFSTAAELAARAGRKAPYSVEVIVERAGPVRSSSGVEIVASRGIGDVAPGDLDTLIVTGGITWRRSHSEPMRAFVRASYEDAKRMASVCIGAFWLAEAAILDGRRPVTHWAWCDRFAAAYPRVRLERDAIFVRDGRVWTSAGVTAGIDLALALVEHDCGRDLSLATARALVMFMKRPGGQSQFSAWLDEPGGDDGPIAETCRYIVERPAENLTVETLAERVGMSPRHFARIFKRQTNKTPAAFVNEVRVEAARRALCSSSNTHASIAQSAGFPSADIMRLAFLRTIGVTPTEYRSRFRS